MAETVVSPEELGLITQRETLTASIAKRQNALANHPNRDGAEAVLKSEKQALAEIEARIKVLHSKK